MPHLAAATRLVSSVLGGFLRSKKIAPKTNHAKKTRMRVTTPIMSILIAFLLTVCTLKSVEQFQASRGSAASQWSFSDCLVNAEIVEGQSGGKEDRELVRFRD